MKYTFGDIVIVEDTQIGVIVKSWIRNNNEIYHEVYVRNLNGIQEYPESKIQRYMVRHKELSEEEIEYQQNAVNPFITQEEIAEFRKRISQIIF